MTQPGVHDVWRMHAASNNTISNLAKCLRRDGILTIVDDTPAEPFRRERLTRGRAVLYTMIVARKFRGPAQATP